MLEKVDTFVVYLGTDAMYGKMDVRFVISDPENLLEHFFTKKNFSKKIETYMTAVPTQPYSKGM